MENINNKNKENKELNNNNENIDEIIIQYKIDDIEYSKIRIFGGKFVENNKNKCKIIINGKEFELTENINIDMRI